MNRKGDVEWGGDILKDPVVHLVLLALFVIGMLFFINSQASGAGIWEDYYAKEIVKAIDFSKGGGKICLDVHKATEVAKKNKVGSFSEIFRIDNVKNEICVKLSRGKRTCFNYLNGVDVVNYDLQLGVNYNEEGRIVNVFCFDVVDVSDINENENNINQNENEEGGENV